MMLVPSRNVYWITCVRSRTETFLLQHSKRLGGDRKQDRRSRCSQGSNHVVHSVGLNMTKRQLKRHSRAPVHVHARVFVFTLVQRGCRSKSGPVVTLPDCVRPCSTAFEPPRGQLRALRWHSATAQFGQRDTVLGFHAIPFPPSDEDEHTDSRAHACVASWGRRLPAVTVCVRRDVARRRGTRPRLSDSGPGGRATLAHTEHVVGSHGCGLCMGATGDMV